MEANSDLKIDGSRITQDDGYIDNEMVTWKNCLGS